jgi:cytochrome c
MWVRAAIGILAFCAGLSGVSSLASEPGDPAKGREVYRACVACHSMEPGRHMTGPSLAGIWGRKAGTVEGFTRYSDSLKQSEIIWDGTTLDSWIANPQAYIPGSRMPFRGLADDEQRRDLIAFLRLASQQSQLPAGQQSQGMPEGETGGMMRQSEVPDLKNLQANNRIVSLGYCGDTYTVTTENGAVHDFWEFNLRFKTDGSDKGPEAQHPVIIPASMMGDRAFVVFAGPAEISAFITSDCPQ